MRNAGMMRRPRRFNRSCQQHGYASPSPDRSSDNPDEGMADSLTIVELDDAFLGLNHQDVQNVVWMTIMHGVAPDWIFFRYGHRRIISRDLLKKCKFTCVLTFKEVNG